MSTDVEDSSFWLHARETPDRMAVIDEQGTALAAGHLLALTNRISNALAQRGLRSGDVVATLLPSGVDLLAMMLATQQVGLRLLPINPRARFAETRHILQDSAPRILIADPDCARGGPDSIVESGSSDQVEWIRTGWTIEERLEPLISGVPDRTPVPRLAGSGLSYTSGTTGLPKAVLRSPARVSPEEFLRPFLRWYTQSFKLDSGVPGVYLSACPLYFSGPMSFASYAMHLGRTVVAMPQWNARLALAMIAQYKVTETFLVPYQLADLIELCRRRSGAYDLGSLRAIIHGASLCPVRVKEEALSLFGDIVYECYGATEVAGTVAGPQDAKRYKGTVGRPVPPQDVKILDEHGLPCAPGVPGRVFMKMFPGMEFSYKDDPQATRNNQSAGYATAGDIGYLNDAGFLFLVGRTSEVINCRGEKVYPAAVEQAALDCPEVADAVAFGEASDGGDIVRLIVRLSTECEAPDEVVARLFKTLARTLTRAELPESIILAGEIPRDTSGKVRRNELGAQLRLRALREIRRDFR